MEKSDRQSEEETYLWIPCQFIDQTLKAILKCLGILHNDSPTNTTETTSSPVTLSLPDEKEEEKEKEKEEEDVAMENDVVVTTRAGQNGVVLRSRATKAKGKRKEKERPSRGSPGQVNTIET